MRDSNPLRSVFTIVVIPPFSQCFQRFPHGSQFTAIHCNSLQLPEKRGQNVGTESEVHVLSHVGFDLAIFLRRADSQQPHGIVLALNIAFAKAFDESCGFEFFGDLAYAVVSQLLSLRIARLIADRHELVH